MGVLSRRHLISGVLAASAAAGATFAASPAAAQVPGVLDGKVAVVTGGTSGIGAVTVAAFARAGAKVAFNGRREALGRDVEASIRAAGGDVTYIKSDVRDAGQMERLVAETVKATPYAFSRFGQETTQRAHRFRRAALNARFERVEFEVRAKSTSTAGLAELHPKNTARIITKTHNATPLLIRKPIVAVRSDDDRYSLIGALQQAEWPAATALAGLFEVPRMPKARGTGFLILLSRSFEPPCQVASGICDVNVA